jgi:hypothetical protein
MRQTELAEQQALFAHDIIQASEEALSNVTIDVECLSHWQGNVHLSICMLERRIRTRLVISPSAESDISGELPH